MVWIGKSNRNGKSLKSMDPRLSGLVCFGVLRNNKCHRIVQVLLRNHGVPSAWCTFCGSTCQNVGKRWTNTWLGTHRWSAWQDNEYIRIRSLATAGQVTVTLKLMFAVSLPESDKTTAALQDSARKSPDNWKVFSSGWLRRTHKSYGTYI